MFYEETMVENSFKQIEEGYESVSSKQYQFWSLEIAYIMRLRACFVRKGT